MPRRSKVEELKNLLSGNTLSTLSMVGFEEIATSGDALLAMTNTLTQSILNAHYVILNVVKNLSESTDVRLLCYPIDPSLSLRMNCVKIQINSAKVL